MINYSDFEKVDIRVGTIIEAKLNQKSNKPSLYLVINFGVEIGKKKNLSTTHKKLSSRGINWQASSCCYKFPS